MDAKYDLATDTYNYKGRSIKRWDLLGALGVRWGTGQELLEMLIRARARVCPERELSSTELHICYIAHLKDRTLPDWVFEAYEKQKAA